MNNLLQVRLGTDDSLDSYRGALKTMRQNTKYRPARGEALLRFGCAGGPERRRSVNVLYKIYKSSTGFV
jgi:hypothetical protein